MKLESTVTDVRSLSGKDRDAMFRLMDIIYSNMRRERFDADLAAKQWVILVRSPDDRRLVGFSTQVVIEARVNGELVPALYSGDTVIDRDHWGDTALAHAWGNFAINLIESYEPRQLYWFLTSKGFRTYRYLPLFFRRYYPRADLSTALPERSIIDAFGRQIGGKSYDPIRQILYAARYKDRVRHEIAGPGNRLSTDPHVRFFAERNPGFVRGDELCCLAPLARDNFTPAAYRVIHALPSPVPAV